MTLSRFWVFWIRNTVGVTVAHRALYQPQDGKNDVHLLCLQEPGR
ncbi:MAG TPA: hypothetical protein VIX73_05910 [Kofleriaceae bacterium]